MFALRPQQAHASEPDLPSVRIGVHLGEVTKSIGPGGTVQVKGLAVDVHARVQGLAKPGQVLMSSAIYNSRTSASASRPLANRYSGNSTAPTT